MSAGIVINPPIILDKFSGGIAYEPVNRRMFVSAGTSPDISPGKVFVIDTTTNTVIGSPISLSGWIPMDISYEPVNKRMYVIASDPSGRSGGFFVIDTTTTPPSVGNPISLGMIPGGIAYEPVHQRMYVTTYPLSGTTGNVSVIDTTTTTPSVIGDPINVPRLPIGIAYEPVHQRMYVISTGSELMHERGHGTVSVIDTTTATPSVIGNPISVGNNALYVAYDPLHERMYVTNFWSHNVSVIDTTTATPSVIGNPISVGVNPADIEYDPVHQRMYVTNDGSNNVSVIDTNTVIDTYYVVDEVKRTVSPTRYISVIGPSNVIGSPIPVDRSPDGIEYDPVHQRMYVTNLNSDTLFVIDIGSNAQTICPKENIQHWDKIVFKITSADIARKANMPVDSELDIKILDNPKEVSDIKKKVLDFLHIADKPEARSAIRIISINHTIICA
jgi:DNA-binding beta-propeller fold protein YncE